MANSPIQKITALLEVLLPDVGTMSVSEPHTNIKSLVLVIKTYYHHMYVNIIIIMYLTYVYICMLNSLDTYIYLYKY